MTMSVLETLLTFLLFLSTLLIFKGAAAASDSPGVQLHIREQHVVMDNGLVQVTLSNPDGIVTGIHYNGMDNLLEIHNEERNRGYWDLVWNLPGNRGTQDVIQGTRFKIIMQNEKQVEISFTRTWDSSLTHHPPLNKDKRFIMLQGSHGFYSYAIVEHLKGWPDFDLGLIRMAFKLRHDKFHYMAISENRQRPMPSPEDRTSERSETLDYPEAVRLINPIEKQFKGQVDDKYQYSCNNEDCKVHGWVSSDPPVGFWVITPSIEFRSGGPLKQELTSHVGPTALSVFLSAHYSGVNFVPTFRKGEAWKKVYGPVFIYLNSGPDGTKANTLWDDAYKQMETEVQSWPYSFPASEDFPKSEQRGSVHGTLLVRDRFISKLDIWAASAYVGLALPGEIGSWQMESKGYQFWTKASRTGSFYINNVRAGYYNLYAWVPGVIGDYKYETIINIIPGRSNNLGNIVFQPLRDGPTLWEIGVPDRKAGEFFIPDPNSLHINDLYINQDRFRQYGLWEQYDKLYPNKDLAYIIGVSDYRKDWFFAHVTRNNNNSFGATTWRIHFRLHKRNLFGTYKLRLAIASANGAEVQVRFNNLYVKRPHFTTGLFGRDNAIARHGIHGVYWLYSVDVRSFCLVEGYNTIFLTQTRTSGPFIGVMYDYIRLEGPSVQA